MTCGLKGSGFADHPRPADIRGSQGRVTGIMITQNSALGLGGNVVVENVNAWFWTKEAIAVDGQVYAPTVDAVPPDTRARDCRSGWPGAGLAQLHSSQRARRPRLRRERQHRQLRHHRRQPVRSQPACHRQQRLALHGLCRALQLRARRRIHRRAGTGISTSTCMDPTAATAEWRESCSISRSTPFAAIRTTSSTPAPAFWLRGTPTVGAFFHDNVLLHGDRDEAVRLKSPDCWVPWPVGGGDYSDELCHLFVGPNTYGTDTSGGLAVGDFDGDGRDDVFLANGTGWWYSSAGLTEWRFLRASSLMVGSLRFGRFDDDLKTDVLFTEGRSGSSRRVVSARQSARAAYAGLAFSNSIFGDFDGNGRTDLLYILGSQWYLSPDLAGTWSLVHEVGGRSVSASRRRFRWRRARRRLSRREQPLVVVETRLGDVTHAQRFNHRQRRLAGHRRLRRRRPRRYRANERRRLALQPQRLVAVDHTARCRRTATVPRRPRCT